MGGNRILFIDHSPAFVYGLASYFVGLEGGVSHDLAITFESGIALLKKKKYDIIILDMSIADIDADKLYGVIANKSDSPIVAITINNNATWISQIMLQNGVKCVIVRNAKREEILEGCKAILGGKNHFPHSFVMDLICKPYIFSSGSNAVRQLTSREKSVLKLFCAGCKIKEITVQLKLASSTVSTHKKRIMTKLGLTDNNSFRQYLSTIKLSELEY